MSDTTTKKDKNTDDVFLFGAGTILYALIETTKKVPDALQRLTLGGGPKHSKYFVPIHLKEDLFLLIRKPNRVELGGCQCSVQFPNEMWEGISLNHAYTRILQAYKPHLNAFSGNAFLTIYFGRPDPQAQGDMFPMLAPLSVLRQEKVKEYEAGMRFRRAVTTALNFHREQSRKGGSIPYISHLLAVAALVMEDGGDEDDAIAALLHDAVDNGGGYEALDEISAKFSPKIADIVLACTDTMESPKPEWQRRKEEFLGSLNLVSDSARRVIAADKLHNARCTLSDFRLMGDDVWERFTGKKEGTLWYYRTLAEILGRTGPHLLAAELARVVSEMAKLAEVPRTGLSASVDRIKAEANYQKLQNMIGLDELKQAVERDIGAVLHNQQLRRFGHEEPSTPRLSLVFVGNPGTGKTKVARLLGSIYKNLGLLSKGHVHEVSRADLVGDVIGATEKKTREAIQKAKGGFLFIDEAYALQRSSRNDFGIEAIEVLLKAMSDTPEDFGVIVAGYPEQMNSFLESNPGLRSRFSGREISFPDFTPAQLMEIAEASIKRLNLQITGEALRYFERQFKDAYRNRGASFGNARYVNSVIREAKAALAERLRRAQGEPTYADVVTITVDDVKRVFKNSEKSSVDLPVDEDSLSESLRQLQSLAGIPAVKQEVMELVDLVRFHRAVGKDPRNLLSSHFVFTGNPGTGKTTVARILAQIFRALGLLERGHLVECDRQSLVAGYIGQTAIKTNAVIESAFGGVLFIDEAYSLTSTDSSNDFGSEAIEVLLKRMEDQRGQFVVIVAGYPREMEDFLTSNPGLKSRFDTFINFEDYDSGELSVIARSLFAEEELAPDDDAANLIKDYFDRYVRSRDRYSGNARDVRNLVKKSIRNQNLRLSRAGSQSRDGVSSADQRWIRAEDLSNWKLQKGQGKHTMGFVGGDDNVD